VRWCVCFLAQGSRWDFAYLAFRFGGLPGRVTRVKLSWLGATVFWENTESRVGSTNPVWRWFLEVKIVANRKQTLSNTDEDFFNRHASNRH